MTSEAASVQELQASNKHEEEKEGTIVKSLADEVVQHFAEAKDICNGNGKIAPLEDETKDEVAKDPAPETLPVNNIEKKLDAPNSISSLVEEAEKLSENPKLSCNVEITPVVVETIDEAAKEYALGTSAIDKMEGKSDAPNSVIEEVGEPSEKPMSSKNGKIVPLMVEMKDETVELASETPVVNNTEEKSDVPELVIPSVEVVDKPSEKLMSSEDGERVPLVAQTNDEVSKEPATGTQIVNCIEENPDAHDFVNPLVEAIQKLSENSMPSDNGETTPPMEETKYVVAKELDLETPLSSVEKLNVPNSVNPLVEVVENPSEKPMSSDNGEKTPLVVKMKDEVAKEPVLETPSVTGPEEKSDARNFVKTSEDEAIENHLKKPNIHEMEPSNPLSEDETGGSNLVQFVGEQLQKSDVPIREEENKSIVHVVPEMEVEKYVDIPSTELTMPASEVVEAPTDDNLESLPAAKLLKDLLGLTEEHIDTTTSEADSFPINQPPSNMMDNKLKDLESKAIDISEIPIEVVFEAPKAAVETTESPQRHDDASDGITLAADVPSQINAVTCAAVESISDVKVDDDTSKVVIAVDRSIEVEPSVHLEEASSQVEKIPEETKKHDSTLCMINGPPSDTHNTISEVEDTMNDVNEVCRVPLVVAVSTQDVTEKVEKEDLPCDLDEVTTQIKVLPREIVFDSVSAPSVTVEAKTTIVSEVTNVSEVLETLEDQSEVHPPSIPEELVVKEVIESSGDAREAVVTDIVNTIDPQHVTQTTACEGVQVVPVEAADISKTIQERAIQTSNLVAIDEKKLDDGAESVVETIVKEVDEEIVAASVPEKLVDEKSEAIKGTRTVYESIVSDSRKTDEKNDDSIESHGHNLADALKNTADTKPETEATKQVVLTKTRSPNMISKVKHSLGKAKKAIFGKSHSSKAISTESKADRKA